MADAGGELAGTVVCRRLGHLRVSLVEGGPGELLRPGRLVDRTGDGVLRVCRPLTGEIVVHQDGRRAPARSPDLVCFDSSAPYRVVFPERFRMMEMRLPHRWAGLDPSDARLLTASPWPGTRGPGALLSSLLAGIEPHCREPEDSLGPVGDSFAGLTGALLTERMKAVAPGTARTGTAMMPRIQTFIRGQLGDPQLSPALVARHCNISLRYLQKLFEEQGTSPARSIRDQRLARCEAELADACFDHLPVSLIGERAGFVGASQFSRLFRIRYDLPPREYRRRAQAGRAETCRHRTGHRRSAQGSGRCARIPQSACALGQGATGASLTVDGRPAETTVDHEEEQCPQCR
ncbi:helix-turn-helix domain-containing protein [Micromonospora sp. NPDC005189]|uniref:helix-turn-helix domain-containing protein n=1 Tax=unclassified Micromonospora TaxID=2617518 RepID=UPI0033A44A49